MSDRANTRVLLAAAAAAAALTGSRASAQILYEPFNYANGVQLDSDAAGANKNFTTSGTYWSQRGSQTGLFTVVNPGLTGPTAAGPFPPNMGGALAFPTSGATGRTPTLGFGQTITSGDAYYSLQLKAPSGTLGATAGFFAGFANFAIPSGNSLGIPQAGLRYQRSTTTSYQLGIQNNNTSTTSFFPTNFTSSDVVNVVVRYRIVPGDANDLIDMWVNPTTDLGAATPPTASVPQITNAGDSVDAGSPSLPMIAGFFARSFSSMNGFQLDELRVDTTWAGVAPDGTKQYTYNNAAGGAWTGGANWNNHLGAPAAADPNALGDVANFGPAVNSGNTITVDGGGKTVDTINFTNPGSLTVAGDPLTFSSNASAAQVYGYAGTHTISAPITLASNLSIKAQSGSTVTLGGAITGAGKTLGIYGNGTGAVKLGASNLIDDGVRLEARSGTLDLNGFSETVDVVQLGTSHPNNGTALGGGTPYNGDLASGNIANGNLTANAYDLQSGTISASLGGTNGVVKNFAGFVTLSGNNTYTGNTVVNSGRLTLSGTNSNPVVAVINAPPTIGGAISNLSISSDANMGAVPGTPLTSVTIGNSTTSGVLEITDNMTLHANRTIDVQAPASRVAVSSLRTATIAGKITGTGGLAAAGGATSTLVLTNTDSDYAGNTTVSSGRLQLPNSDVAPGYNVAGKWVVANNAALVLNAGGPGEWTDAEIDNVRATATFSAAGSLLGIDPTNAPGGTYAYPSNIAGTHGMAKAGGGTLTLTGNNTYTGPTNVLGGVLRVTADNQLGDATGITFVSGGTAGATATLLVDGGGTGLTLNEPVTIEGKASGNVTPHVRSVNGNNAIVPTVTMDASGAWYNLQADAGSKLTLSNISNPTNSTARQINLRGDGEGVLSGGISNTAGITGVISVAKFDAGTWRFNGANAYAGTTTVNAGTLQANTTAALPGYNAPAKVIVNAGGTIAANVGGPGEWQTADVDALRTNATLAAGSSVGFDTTNAAGGSFTYPTNMSGGHGVTKLGTGTLVLTGTNTYTGGTNVNAGTLQVSRMHESNPVSITAGKLQVMDSSPTLPAHPSGDNAFVSRPSALAIANDGAALGARTYNGQLDLGNNDLILDYDGASPIADIEDMVRAGYNGGDWTGNGITSSTANANRNFALAVADNSRLTIQFDGTRLFSGQAVDSSTILVKFTHRIDLDLDGVITTNDATIFNSNYSEGAPAYWSIGDVDYDRVFTSNDATIFNGFYSEALASVPEPATLSVLGIGALGLLQHRRRTR